MHRTPILILTLSLGLSSTALAQRNHEDSIPFTRSQLNRIAERFATQVQRQGLNGHLQDLTQRMTRQSGRMAQQGEPRNRRPYERFMQTYRETRRALLREPRISDNALDTWDRLVVQWARVRQTAVPIVRPRPSAGPYGNRGDDDHDRDEDYGNISPHYPRIYPTEAPRVEFRGAFEETSAYFSGPSIESLHQQCMNFVASENLRRVDDVRIGNRTFHNRPSYWDARGLCSIVALNANSLRTRRGSLHVVGQIEDVPFDLYGSNASLRNRLQRYVPAIMDDHSVDDLTVNGQTLRNGPSYWSVREVVEMIAHNSQPAPRTEPPAQRPSFTRRF